MDLTATEKEIVSGELSQLPKDRRIFSKQGPRIFMSTTREEVLSAVATTDAKATGPRVTFGNAGSDAK
jgi:hypothetical protein